EGPRVVWLVGFAVFALAQLVAVVRMGRADFGRTEPELDPPHQPEADLAPVKPLGLNKLRFGAAGLFVAALLLVVAFPALESEQRDPTILADYARNYVEGT
ncbi:MAG: hypothetical protein GWM93_16625, partial [Gemmatimonadetes bacterium]|nr:hypothetical protein [Gemmatimonadota bacterium]NIT68281.1 hypothetical protein [Gemmatimonadota bacterium]NIY36858.1 hypothetical protein [Gemmatimonadota bacterium]